MTTDLERRFTRERVTLRAADDGSRKIGGYAAKFMRRSQNLGGFVEQVGRDFFSKSEGDGWPGVMARYNHTMLLGTTAAASLRLVVDEVGLDYEVDLLDDADSDRVLKLVRRGDVAQSSFAFYTIEDDWSLTEDGFPLRTLIAGRTVDVAPVDQPAYLDTSTGLRSLAEQRDVDLDEVKRLAQEGELQRLLKPAPVVVDLGDPTNVRSAGQGDSHPPIGVQAKLRALELNKQH